MEVVRGEVSCRRGRMGLSKVAQADLEEIVEAPPTPAEPTSFGWGGRWHCPADGVHMVEEDGVVRCPTCDRCLPRRVMHMLMEFHHHRSVSR